jgi:hypothetical protein
MSLWAEHLGNLEEAFGEPQHLECMKRVRKISRHNWKAYVSEEGKEMRGDPVGTIGCSNNVNSAKAFTLWSSPCITSPELLLVAQNSGDPGGTTLVKHRTCTQKVVTYSNTQS